LKLVIMSYGERFAAEWRRGRGIIGGVPAVGFPSNKRKKEGVSHGRIYTEVLVRLVGYQEKTSRTSGRIGVFTEIGVLSKKLTPAPRRLFRKGSQSGRKRKKG